MSSMSVYVQYYFKICFLQNYWGQEKELGLSLFNRSAHSAGPVVSICGSIDPSIHDAGSWKELGGSGSIPPNSFPHQREQGGKS